MTTPAIRSVLDNLLREIGRIEHGGGTFHDVSKVPDFRAFTPAPPDARIREVGSAKAPEERGPFGRWLLRQAPEGLLGPLIKAAGADPKFPLDGDPDAVRARLHECGAIGNMFEALDDAELDWAAL